MGAWDATSFGNDTANDWAYGLEKTRDLSYIDKALQKVLDTGGDYLEAPEAEEAIAAAEVLAWLHGRPTPVNSFTEKIQAWAAANPLAPPAGLTQKALSVLDRIQREPSELMELWEDDAGWDNALADLRVRLTI
jgi:hypothetical protein